MDARNEPTYYRWKQLTIENVMSNVEVLSGPPFDEFGCFHIRDFETRDCIQVRLGSGKLVNGVVTSVDFNSNVIKYSTGTDTDCVSTIDDIVSLREPESGWLHC